MLSTSLVAVCCSRASPDHGSAIAALEVTYVFNRNHGLIRKGRDQINLPGSKGPGIRSGDDNDTDRNTFSEQRDAEYRSEVLDLLNIMIFRIGSNSRVREPRGALARPDL